MSKRWNNQTQDWETDVVETKEELVAPETVELPPVVVPEEFGNVELVEIPIEVVNVPRWYEVIGNVINNYPLTVGVLGVVLFVVVWQLLKK